MHSIEIYICPPGEFRVGAFGRRWSKGWAVRGRDGLMTNPDGTVMCFRQKKTAGEVADSLN